jgi:prepilin-type N-terminal cleavage/methylation domain-containing protein
MKRKGFSIIEVLVALAIFSIAILGIGAAILYSINFAKQNEQREEALYKADKLLNYLMSLSYDHFCLADGTQYRCETDNGTCCNDLAGDPEVGYSVNETPDIKTIKVTVSLKNGNYTLEQIKGNW